MHTLQTYIHTICWDFDSDCTDYIDLERIDIFMIDVYILLHIVFKILLSFGD